MVIKEGAEYAVEIVFKINNTIVSGLRYIQAVKRAGIVGASISRVRIDSSLFMMGKETDSIEGWNAQLTRWNRWLEVMDRVRMLLKRDSLLKKREFQSRESYAVRTSLIRDLWTLTDHLEWSLVRELTMFVLEWLTTTNTFIVRSCWIHLHRWWHTLTVWRFSVPHSRFRMVFRTQEGVVELPPSSSYRLNKLFASSSSSHPFRFVSSYLYYLDCQTWCARSLILLQPIYTLLCRNVAMEVREVLL